MKAFLKDAWKTLLFFAVVGLIGGFTVGLYQLESYPAEALQELYAQGLNDTLIGLVTAVQSAGYGLVLGTMGIWLGKKVRKPGTLAQYALVLWALAQIFPEALRCDNVLYVLVFARVTHLGLACTVGFALLRLLWQGAKHGLGKKEIALDVLGLAAGIGLCIGMIFALDKTNWPKLAVYAGLLLALVELGFVVCRRIAKEDVAA